MGWLDVAGKRVKMLDGWAPADWGYFLDFLAYACDCPLWFLPVLAHRIGACVLQFACVLVHDEQQQDAAGARCSERCCSILLLVLRVGRWPMC